MGNINLLKGSIEDIMKYLDNILPIIKNQFESSLPTLFNFNYNNGGATNKKYNPNKKDILYYDFDGIEIKEQNNGVIIPDYFYVINKCFVGLREIYTNYSDLEERIIDKIIFNSLYKYLTLFYNIIIESAKAANNYTNFYNANFSLNDISKLKNNNIIICSQDNLNILKSIDKNLNESDKDIWILHKGDTWNRNNEILIVPKDPVIDVDVVINWKIFINEIVKENNAGYEFSFIDIISFCVTDIEKIKVIETAI